MDKKTILLTASVTCPCGQVVTGTWTDLDAETEQACPSCGHLCLAAWPGWTFQPRVARS